MTLSNSFGNCSIPERNLIQKDNSIIIPHNLSEQISICVVMKGIFDVKVIFKIGDNLETFVELQLKSKSHDIFYTGTLNIKELNIDLVLHYYNEILTLSDYIKEDVSESINITLEDLWQVALTMAKCAIEGKFLKNDNNLFEKLTISEYL
jgi:hypothetical protein